MSSVASVSPNVPGASCDPSRPSRPAPSARRLRAARCLLAALGLLAGLGVGCASRSRGREAQLSAAAMLAKARGTTVFGPAAEFTGSSLPDVGTSGLFPARTAAECQVSMLTGGEDSFAVRMDLLKSATHSIRIQALIYTADESGLRVAEILKQKKQQGLDVRVIVDGLSNPSLQTQWMYFDLKQHGVEVEGYEAIGLQWLNEVPVPLQSPHYDPLLPNKRYHEKLWITDAGTPQAQAVTGGLNIANEYFRVDPANVPRYWRDQDVLVRGRVLDDLTTSFERNWQHFKSIKRERGNLTDAAWESTRALLARTGKPQIPYTTRADLTATVARLEARAVPRQFEPARCRFFQSRPRLRESYIQQAYLKLLASARREVLLANAYFVPTAVTAMAIKEAAHRCVRVVILANSAETNDTPGITVLGRSYYADLLSVNESAEARACQRAGTPGGVEIWEWMGKRQHDPKPSQGLLHAKFVVVDRVLSLVGSHNLDPRSERLNSESALVYENAALAETLARTFLEQDLASSRRISAAEAATFEKPDKAYQRFKKDLAGMFEEHL
ncbi:MAG: phosphatidylserine/phosphatidylglycerophosphate/cardiolipin synthase family protein [Myxococcales bacterium]|nr:phosphatidylserine/phosphatidylglycerophosphate/cardiolipin synthase family protein [Myxococcales bacterium]